MVSAGLFLLLLTVLPEINGSKISDCLDAKYYHFNPDHTACVTKSTDAVQSGISTDQKTLITTLHNQLRSLQNATDMQKMVWDNEVANLAQRWADNCKFAHDKIRSIPGRFAVGQNLATGQNDWGDAVQAWYSEIEDFTYGNKSLNKLKLVGHFTQLVWAHSVKLGCGYAECSNLRYKKLYVCNYGPAGNANDWSAPYTQGNQCENCPMSCQNGLCDCEGKVCHNGGRLDVRSCSCECKKPWQTDSVCTVNCSLVQERSSCKPGGAFNGKCFQWRNVPYSCPLSCNVCPYSDPAYQSDMTGDDESDDESDDGMDDKPENGSGATMMSTATSVASIFMIYISIDV